MHLNNNYILKCPLNLKIFFENKTRFSMYIMFYSNTKYPFHDKKKLYSSIYNEDYIFKSSKKA